MSDFSDSSHSGVVSPASSLIDNFHKKTGASPSNSSSMSTIGSTSPAINGGLTTAAAVTTATNNLGGATNGLALSNVGRHLNTTSSSSSSSLKETSSTSQQVR